MVALVYSCCCDITGFMVVLVYNHCCAVTRFTLWLFCLQLLNIVVSVTLAMR